MACATLNMQIPDIKVGTRVRKDFGDVASLGRSIEDFGLLQPIVVRLDGTLVCGLRRIMACELLGRPEIPCYVCESVEDEYELLRAQLEENTCRKPLTPEELARAAARS